jgi:CPA1 family monovalent cation:H+ antiporter
MSAAFDARPRVPAASTAAPVTQDVLVHLATTVVALLATVGLVGTIGARVSVSVPLVLVVLGVVASLVPGVPDVSLDPDLVLVGLLPPLLYAAALSTSLFDLKANRRAILLLSVGAVVFTAAAVGLATWLVLPGVSFAAALALGAVVAPPDAVAATAVGRRAGMPRKVVSILEGESLLNDATALVTLNAAIAATTGAVSVWGIGGDLLLAAGGGVAIGYAVAHLLTLVRRRVDDPVLDTSLSFLAPYLAFLPAQEVEASGVLAVVVTGLVLGHRSPGLQSGASRISERMNWATISFLLENVVFLLIGLQVRPLLEDVRDEPLGRTLAVCAVAVAVVLVARVVWVFGSALVFRVGTASMRESAWSWTASAVVSWAGMRGVVTLAAAFLLPRGTPERPVLVLAAFVVVAGSLLAQGTTLPAVVRRSGLTPPSPAEDTLQEASLLDESSRAGLARLDREAADTDPPEVLDQLRQRAELRANGAWERLGRPDDEQETPSAAYRRLRLLMLETERETVVQARDRGAADDVVLRRVMAAIDVEESLLDRLDDRTTEVRDDLRAPALRSGDCEHLHEAPLVVRPRTPHVCAACEREGTRWVHLRTCLTCGEVGCCDSSPQRHATGHFEQTGHPVMRSHEPGESWRWCYVDNTLG